MSTTKYFTKEKAETIGKELGLKWRKFDVEQFRMGLDVELEHGTQDKKTDVTGDDELTTAKIALAHLTEFPDYYTRLEKMEEEAERYHSMRGRVEELGKMAKAEFGEFVSAAEPTLTEMGARIQHLTGIEDEKLEEAKTELDHAWSNLRKTFDKFAAKVG